MKYYWGNYTKSFIKVEISPSNSYIVEKGHREWNILKDRSDIIELPFQYKNAKYNVKGQIEVEVDYGYGWEKHILDPHHNYNQMDTDLFKKLKGVVAPHIYTILAKVQPQTNLIVQITGSLENNYTNNSIPDAILANLSTIDITEASSGLDLKIDKVILNSDLGLFFEDGKILIKDKWSF